MRYFFWCGQSFSWFILSHSNLVSGRVSGNIIDGEISWFRQGPKCYERSRWVCHIFDQFPADTFEEVRPKTGVVEYHHSKSFILEFHYINGLITWPVSRGVKPQFLVFIELSIIKVKHCRHWAVCWSNQISCQKFDFSRCFVKEKPFDSNDFQDLSTY